MSFIQNLFTSRDNGANSETYIGQKDRLWWDPISNKIRVSDGVTPGGFPITATAADPGGADTQVQFNNQNYFAGSSLFTFNPTAQILRAPNLTVSGNITPLTTNQYDLGNANYRFSNVYLSNTGNVYLGNISIGSDSSNTVIFSGNVKAEGYSIGNTTITQGANNTVVFSGNIQTAEIIAPSGSNLTLSSNNKNWVFDIAGNLTLPTSTSSINYANGRPYGAFVAGSNTQIQFNNQGNLGASSGLTYDITTSTLTALNISGNGASISSITGANVTGTVGNAAHATIADSANSVSVANVSGFTQVAYSYTDTTINIVTVPVGKTITEISIIVNTPFNDPTAIARVGTASNAGLFMGSTDSKITRAGTYAVMPGYFAASNTTVQLSVGSGTSTTGNGLITLNYR